ncbi:ABC transporter permease [Actinophytocola sp.]|uniref:ABC transporter permease n=1 Tax=Actinophytocola sp. TaxID=1872138 RepID=UPI002D7F8A22|nr:ABC transporter permease [Actinophytocola sp.]HET9141888.1 ABC transporter permease [Actinophytocola sp.]
MSDLRLGVRLAIGGGRTSKTGVARLVLSTIGIGLAVAVLLIAASTGPMFDARTARQSAQVAWPEPVPGVDPLYLRWADASYRDLEISGFYVNSGGPRHPMPPGVSRLPGHGEIVLSEPLAELLAGPAGAQLRPRFPQRVIGTIGRDGVTDPTELVFYAGDAGVGAHNAQPVYRYGWAQTDALPGELTVLISVGTVVLLVPVFVFIAMSARIAGAERDRRLAALRLVGADTRQTRRIAAAESLTSAVTGLAFGVGLFLAFRTMVGEFPILGVRPFPQDVSPPWPLVLLIALLVPGMAVGAALAARRRTIIEPLGVLRRGRPVRRRLWWRLVPIGAGVTLILGQGDVSSSSDNWVPAVVVGVALLLAGIPILLPWLLERVVARVHGGRPAAQLAVRRLQLDSGTPARVVSGVVVVLAGAIALQTVVDSQTRRFEDERYLPLRFATHQVLLDIYDADRAEVAARLRAVPGVQDVFVGGTATAEAASGEKYSLVIADCAELLRAGAVDTCTDGQVFSAHPNANWDRTRPVTLMYYRYYAGPYPGATWRIPAKVSAMRVTPLLQDHSWTLVATPGALRGVEPQSPVALGVVELDPGDADALERVRNAVAPYGWRVNVETPPRASMPTTLELFRTIRGALLGGALFTLLLAGVSMLVLALEQVRERRRPLAALAASGIPIGTLARSLLWQNAIPVLVGVVFAVGTGIGLTALVFRLLGQPVTLDWGNVALFSAAAAGLVLLVTLLTMPTLRSATRLAALRSE